MTAIKLDSKLATNAQNALEIASRLAHSCVRIALDGTDRRRAAA